MSKVEKTVKRSIFIRKIRDIFQACKIKRILRPDWLPERARYFSCSVDASMKTQEPSNILILFQNYISLLNITELSNKGLLKMQFSSRLLIKFLF